MQNNLLEEVGDFDYTVNKETRIEHIEVYDEDINQYVPAVLVSTTDIYDELSYTIFDYDSLVSAVADLLECKEYLESFLED